MTTRTRNGKVDRLPRFGQSAADIMTRNPLSINHDVTMRDAAAFLSAKGISAAPVINEAGRPVGVISRADLLRHAHSDDLGPCTGRRKTVGEIMSHDIFFVKPNASVPNVIDGLLACKVHRLFVVDDQGLLIGVISVLDLLRNWHAENSAMPSTDSARN